VVADPIISHFDTGREPDEFGPLPPKLADRGGNTATLRNVHLKMKTLDEINERQSLIGSKWWVHLRLNPTSGARTLELGASTMFLPRVRLSNSEISEAIFRIMQSDFDTDRIINILSLEYGRSVRRRPDMEGCVGSKTALR
jgi:hypothetical protein